MGNNERASKDRLQKRNIRKEAFFFRKRIRRKYETRRKKRQRGWRDNTKKEKYSFVWQRRNAAETSVTGIRGWIEDFDDKYLITLFQWWSTEMNCDSSIIAAFLSKPSFRIIKKRKKSRQWCADHFFVSLQCPSSCECSSNMTVRVDAMCFFPFPFPCVYESLVTTCQLTMKYGTNYPIMSEKGSELVGAWLKSNLTLISPNPLAGSNRGLKSHLGISY